MCTKNFAELVPLAVNRAGYIDTVSQAWAASVLSMI